MRLDVRQAKVSLRKPFVIGVMMNLDELAQEVAECSRCPLRGDCTQSVPGLGKAGATYFVLGEAPGKDEDESGVPFVGLAGKRLTKLLAIAKIDPNDCYITNTIKCRPPSNRLPKKAERLACYPWLKKELELVKPKYIITLGATPLSLFTQIGVKQLHGTSFEYDLDGRKVTIIVQYHPAAALHAPRLWGMMLTDWEFMPQKVDASYIIVSPREHPHMVAFDTENDPSGKLAEWSLAFRDEKGALCVEPHVGTGYKPRLTGKVIFHNAKWDVRVLAANNMPIPKPEQVLDTMIMAYCMGLGRQDTKDNGRSGDQMVGGLGLKYLGRRHLGLPMKTWEEVKDSPTEDKAEYNATDSIATYLLAERWLPVLPKHFFTIDMPLLDVIMKMEDRGIKVDPNFLTEYAQSLDKQLAAIDIQVGGKPLNPFSSKQVAEYVYGTLGYEVSKKTKNGAPSTDSEVLETIDDPIIKKILQYREFYKERNTYVSNYVNRLDPDSRIHSEFKQTSTATARLSSARPNLQNVTKDTGLRKLFIAKDGYKLVRVDWSQLELRTFAALTQDPVMLKALEMYDKTGDKKYSIHQNTADALVLKYDDGKVINFLMLYGGGAFKISQEFHVPIDQAKELIERYYSKYPMIKKYHEQQIALARTQRKVVSWTGRERRLDAMYSEHWKTIKEGEREAINTPIQCGAIEIVKLAMIDLHYKHQAPAILQVHDELIFEVPTKEAKDYAQWLKTYIPTIVELNGVKFPVDVGVGANWAEAKGV